ncbi:MAG: class I SAM-dependent methyltransferase [Solirubrobacterales bacterium]|nr:class I SAM-dependent methyltransferase [Solirubrobacterales bacterium]
MPVQTSLLALVPFANRRRPRRCPVCDSGAVRPLMPYANPPRRDGRRRVSQTPALHLIGCATCGAAHSHPLPTDEELDAFYTATDGWDDRVDAEAREAVERKLADKRRYYAHELEDLRPYLIAPEADRQPAVFDFGCGIGAWLDVLAGDGWLTFGLEPGAAAREIAGRRHPMLDEIPTDERFDLIIVNHVLEHVRDPLAVVRSLARCLKDDGLMLIGSPHLARLPEHGRFSYVASGVHIFSWTPSGLASLLAMAGLEILEVPEEKPGTADDPHVRRLRRLARKTGQIRAPSGEPLREAQNSLSAWAKGGGSIETARQREIRLWRRRMRKRRKMLRRRVGRRTHRAITRVSRRARKILGRGARRMPGGLARGISRRMKRARRSLLRLIRRARITLGRLAGRG